MALLVLGACAGEGERISTTSGGSDEMSSQGDRDAAAGEGAVREGGSGEANAESAAEGDAGLQQTGEPTSGEFVEFVIPLEPVTTSSLVFSAEVDEVTGEPVVTSETTVRLAVGDEYPDTMRYEINDLVFFDGVEPGSISSLTVRSTTVTQADAGVEVDVEADTSLQLRVLQPGTHRVELSLLTTRSDAALDDAALDDGAEATSIVLAAMLVVEAKQVTGAEWSNCADPRYAVSGSAFNSSRLYALDEQGVIFGPDNAGFDRGADIIVRALAGTEIVAPAGIDSLVINGPSQTVTVRSNYGSVATVELIQPEEIDVIEPSLYSDQGGARGGGSGVANGGRHAVVLADAPYLSVFPGAHYRDTILCAGPEATLFELTSSTPEVCEIDPDGCATRGCFTNRYVPATASILSAGTCKLELRAPTLNHGRGLSVSLRVGIDALDEAAAR